jgi:pSer/pThr/pTyr-binding forkhead associated (FHA) protein|tara:strand:- start:731 stop:1069 length:339 start_codon:yes stop_codon:yes gene_type:complete
VVPAQIQAVSGHYLIQDMGNTNGIQVEGRAVKQHVLKNEYIVTIGEHQLTCLISESKSDIKPAAVETPDVGKEGRTGYIEVLGGQKSGSKIQLEEGLMTIGEPGVQIATVSK